ncbi:MAG: hypothetical protein LQ350_008516 [Teloschistes chrysophthalmus]|nr:MAG: hypothetical protein LQ350_008516 [Niorma chrysophthalma]
MTDPLSIAGSVAGLTSLGVQVTQSLVDYYKTYRSRESELAGITGRLESLVETFQSLTKALSGRVFRADERSLVKSIETSINSCDESIQELREECIKFNKTSSTGTIAAFKVAGRRLIYPFRQSTLQKIDEDIGEIRANLSIALDVLQLNHGQRLEDDVAEIRALIELVRTNQISSDLLNWLSAPDATIDHNMACAKKHPGTGIWLIKSSKFSQWLTEERSIMWLSGFAGTGKSVLCSTAIQCVLRHRGSDRGIGIAFFYFAFNDDSKQDVSSMIRALLLQLSSQLQDDHADLKRLYESYKTGIPPTSVLLVYLQRLIQGFRHVYILLDALDESPRTGPREHILKALGTIREWGLQHLHLFVTSRDDLDIRESLDLPTTHQVIMQNAGINQDITDFVSGQLVGDRRLRKWLSYHDKIQAKLTNGAKGV